MSGEQITDELDFYFDYYTGATYSEPPPTAMTESKPPPKGACAECGNAEGGVRYCRHSGYPVGSDKALKWCQPVVLGNPWVPRAER